MNHILNNIKALVLNLLGKVSTVPTFLIVLKMVSEYFQVYIFWVIVWLGRKSVSGQSHFLQLLCLAISFPFSPKINVHFMVGTVKHPVCDTPVI